MARIPYADLSHPEAQPLVERIVAERGSVLHLYQMLLHSPAVAGGWLNYLTSIRQLSTLPGDLRELVIMRVAVLNGAPYEADQHAPIALKEGVTQAQLDALDGWQDSALFDARERRAGLYRRHDASGAGARRRVPGRAPGHGQRQAAGRADGHGGCLQHGVALPGSLAGPYARPPLTADSGAGRNEKGRV